MVSFSRPSAGQNLRNYTILDLEDEPVVVRDRWARSILDYRSWCYNSTNERFEFGDMFRRSAMIPRSGQFFFYLKLAKQWLCLVVDGPTSYLIGFITSSIGKDYELQIREMKRPKGIKYIEKSKNMPWHGRYQFPEVAPVGYEAIIIAFLGMHRYVSGISCNPAQRELARWCDIFVVHFPEAGRFDSLLQCNIYNRFVSGGQVGDIPIKKARNWSKDCKYLLDKSTEKVLTEGEDKKWKVKRGGKSKKTMVDCKSKRSGKSKGTMVPSASEVSDERLLTTLNDVRLFHRKNPVPADVFLASMPIQLHNGEAINPPTKELEPSDVNFLLVPFGNVSHDRCTYINDQWVCEVPGSEKRSVRRTAPDASPSMELGMTSHMQNILNTHMRSGSTEKHPVTIANETIPVGMTGQDSSPSMKLGLTSQVENILDNQLKSGSTEKRPASKMDEDVYPRLEIVDAYQLPIHEADLETLTTSQHEELKDMVKDGIVKRHNCGLLNLGNTCYINSTLQCLSTVPELKSSLMRFPFILCSPDSGYMKVNQTCHDLTLAAHDLFLQLSESVGPVDPHYFVEILRKRKPEFSEQHDNVYKQQDAEECWSHLITTFEQALGSESSGSGALSMKELFGIELMKRTRCVDSGEESFRTELIYSLECYISEGVDHLTHGLLQVNSKTTEKFSPDWGAPCNESRIIEIPRYLTVHFSRLHWDNDSKLSQKVLQKVDYPAVFNIKEYCSDELKEKLEATRETIRGSSIKGIDKGFSMKMQQLTGIYDLICVLTHEAKVLIVDIMLHG